MRKVEEEAIRIAPVYLLSNSVRLLGMNQRLLYFRHCAQCSLSVPAVMTVPICKRVCFLQGRANSRANDDIGMILPTGTPSANSRSEFSRSRTQPRDPDHPRGWLLNLLVCEFEKVQTEPNFQGHVRIENGNKFH
jgi:hypothetical protein